MKLLQERVPSLQADATAGLSLGEFTALAAAGSMTFEDGLYAEVVDTSPRRFCAADR